MKVLVLNAGSSTYKSSLFQFEKTSMNPQEPLWNGLVDFDQHSRKNPAASVKEMLRKCSFLKDPDEVSFVGHRVVHGGTYFSRPVLINANVKKTIQKLIPLAPLHNQANLLGIEIMESLYPKASQIAVFDTAFHTTIPESAYAYPISKSWQKKGIRRYGFHGISHEYCSQRAAGLLNQDIKKLKIITCHLGNGASLAAVKEGICIDTTMGFTPLEGLMMGTRSGSIDPSIPLFLQREYSLEAENIEKILNGESGMKGICGHSDFRKLLKMKAEGKKSAQIAFEMYVQSLRRYIGAMAGSLGGVDALVFTGGIGENSAFLRTAVCEAFEWMGLALDLRKNEKGLLDSEIGKKESKVKILLIHTREDWSIARSCLEFFFLKKN